jgi:ribosomal protein S18 acetylase RimI-like enzyme
VTEHVLDNPVWHALTGPHARFADRYGRAAAYHPEVSPFAAPADLDDPAAWRDLARLAGPGAGLAVGGSAPPPAGWEITFEIGGLQFTGDDVRGEPCPEAVRLGPSDVPEMLDMVARVDPGPFRKRAVDLGGYLGIRRGGALVAMAGERQRPPGWTEISTVCTDPAYRGTGLASRLIRAVVAGITDRGDRPFLHVADVNAPAVRIYRALGFTLRTRTRFRMVKVPAGDERPYAGG